MGSEPSMKRPSGAAPQYSGCAPPHERITAVAFRVSFDIMRQTSTAAPYSGMGVHEDMSTLTWQGSEPLLGRASAGARRPHAALRASSNRTQGIYNRTHPIRVHNRTESVSVNPNRLLSGAMPVRRRGRVRPTRGAAARHTR